MIRVAEDGSVSPWIIAVIAFVFLMVAMVIYLAGRYRRCPSDKILVTYGRVGEGKSARVDHGGGRLIYPLIQDYAYLSLIPMTIPIPLQNALSLQNIRVNVPSTFTVGVSTQPQIMMNAAERLLGLNPREIEEMGGEIIFGQLRLTVASLTIEQINQDRESFLQLIRSNVDTELNKVGLHLINVNITDITDESGYIESIGKKAAAEALEQARIDVADARRSGAIGEETADRTRVVEVARQQAEGAKGTKEAEADQRIYVQEQEALAIHGENAAKADIAETNATLAEKEAEALRRADVAKRMAEIEVQKAQYLLEAERLKAEEVAVEEIAKKKMEISAEAHAEQERRIARGQADAIVARQKATAQGELEVLQAKAEGYRLLVNATNGDTNAAATLLLVEKLEELVATQVEAISNLSIDRITVWDSGNGGDGSSTANFVSSLIGSLPPLHEIAAMAGVELPGYLGTAKQPAVPPIRVPTAQARAVSPQPAAQEIAIENSDEGEPDKGDGPSTSKTAKK